MNLTHGETRSGRRSPEFLAWRNMISRCSDTSVRNYKDYGGRGIAVATEWLDFEAFLNDVGRRPSKLHSLDRIDVNGDYKRGNVRWATDKDQCRNRRNNRRISAFGKTLTIAEWAELTNIPYQTIWFRLTKWHWGEERSVTK